MAAQLEWVPAMAASLGWVLAQGHLGTNFQSKFGNVPRTRCTTGSASQAHATNTCRMHRHYLRVQDSTFRRWAVELVAQGSMAAELALD